MNHELIISLECLEQYQGLIFDLDGTLIDTMSAHANAWIEVGEHFGYPFDPQIMYQLTGASVYRIASTMMSQVGMPQSALEDVVKKKIEVGLRYVLQQATLLPAIEIVKQLYGRLPLAIGTGGQRVIVEQVLDKFELKKYFDVIICADDVSQHKPDPETFLRCAQGIDILPNHVLVFEDGDLGIQAAQSAGMDVFDVRDTRLIRKNTA